MPAVAGAVAIALTVPATALADPDPSPSPPPPGNSAGAPPAAPAPPDPNAPPAPPAPPADPNAPVPPADPNAPPAPEAGRVTSESGRFTYVPPAGWRVGDPSRISYGSAVLTKAPAAGQTAPPNDTTILLGPLDLKLFAGAEPDNAKAAVRLASDMGEFYMPFQGTRINQETVPLNAGGLTGTASYYEVDFADEAKPNGQIWAAAIGDNPPRGAANRGVAPTRYFVVWLGTAANPVDKAAAVALAQSIRPWTPPPAPPPPDPNAPPPPPDPNAPPPPPPARPGVGVPVPITEPVPGMAPPA
ncbi:alanine and proline-rich secreted protein Apa [Mycobacterium sp. MYCO198283]|nr:alanine and proline-rich secreted protein Apa [Mycobacterium sp. MYCO198283]